MLGSKLLFLIMLITWASAAQTQDSIPPDSVLSESAIFRSKVARIEFVRVDPICETTAKRIKVDGKLFKKKRRTCYLESALLCSLADFGSDELNCLVDHSRLSEHTEVNQEDCDSVLYLLFETEKEQLLSCYFPRHGILLYDAQNTELGFVEICFECSMTSTSVNVPAVDVLSHENFVKLREIFKKYNL